MPSYMPSDIIEDLILPACHQLNVRGVGEMLTLRTVNKAFRLSFDLLVLAIIKLRGCLLVRPLRLAADWIALGCEKFVREAKMRKEAQSKAYVRFCMYTKAYQICNFERRITHALARSSQDWHSDDQAKRVAAREAFVRIAAN
jgi:hypothetical protein